MQDTDRNKTCCFIGHRKIKESEELKKENARKYRTSYQRKKGIYFFVRQQKQV